MLSAAVEPFCSVEWDLNSVPCVRVDGCASDAIFIFPFSPVPADIYTVKVAIEQRMLIALLEPENHMPLYSVHGCCPSVDGELLYIGLYTSHS